MQIPRREFLRLATAASLTSQRLLGQMASHTTRAQARSTPSGKPFHAHFTDIADQAGLRYPVICGELGHSDYIMETNGTGCAFIDYDNDGWMDLFVLTGTRRSGAPEGTSNRLYKNNRDGTFTDVTEKAGLHRLGWASSVTVGDYNNDGFEDMFCTYWGQNVLYRNNGEGTFTDVTQQAGLTNDPHRWGAGCTFVDFNRDAEKDCRMPKNRISQGAVKLEEVAQRARVSASTVSCALNNLYVVKDSTRLRVLKAVDELGYHPDLHARSLAGGSSRTIGVIVSNLENRASTTSRWRSSVIRRSPASIFPASASGKSFASALSVNLHVSEARSSSTHSSCCGNRREWLRLKRADLPTGRAPRRATLTTPARWRVLLKCMTNDR
jgi:hypothetical protein